MSQLQWVVAAFGMVSLTGVLFKMKGGFGLFNLRVVGIVIVATFATLLGTLDSGKITAAIGILGAIAGYLFGMKDTS